MSTTPTTRGRTPRENSGSPSGTPDGDAFGEPIEGDEFEPRDRITGRTEREQKIFEAAMAEETAELGPGHYKRRTMISTAILALVCLGSVALVSPFSPVAAGGILATVAILYLTRKLVFNWTGLLMALAVIIMIIPVRRYKLPSPFSFALEPYRFIIVLLIVAIVVALLIEPKFKWRQIRFGWPIGFFFFTLVVSIAVNGEYISDNGLASGSIGAVANLLLMVVVFYTVRLLLRTERIMIRLVTVLVWLGAVVGFFSLVERVTKFNIFLTLQNFLPLISIREASEAIRAGGGRAFGSSQHPIALAVVMCLLIPLAIYLTKYAVFPRNIINRRIVYGIATACLLFGVVAAVSRTAVVTLGMMFIVTLILRPKLAGQLIALAIPGVILAYLVTPRTIEETLGSFLDIDALIASQYTSAGWGGAGRLADLEPALELVRVTPFFGTGVGTRIVIGDDANSFILDNQFLGTLLEVGVLGVIGLALLFVVPAIRLLAFSFTKRVSRQDSGLAFALATSFVGYITALFFYDAFNFIQAFMLIFVLMAIAAFVLTESRSARVLKTAALPRRRRR